MADIGQWPFLTLLFGWLSAPIPRNKGYDGSPGTHAA